MQNFNFENNVCSYSVREEKKSSLIFLKSDEKTGYNLSLSFRANLETELKVNRVLAQGDKFKSFSKGAYGSIYFNLTYNLPNLNLNLSVAEVLIKNLQVKEGVADFLESDLVLTNGRFWKCEVNSDIIVKYFLKEFKLKGSSKSLLESIVTLRERDYINNFNFNGSFNEKLVITKNMKPAEDKFLIELSPICYLTKQLANSYQVDFANELSLNNGYIKKISPSSKDTTVSQIECIYKIGNEDKTSFERGDFENLIGIKTIVKTSPTLQQFLTEIDNLDFEYNKNHFYIFKKIIANITTDKFGNKQPKIVEFILRILATYIQEPNRLLSQVERGYVIFEGSQAGGKSLFFKILKAIAGVNVFNTSLSQVDTLLKSKFAFYQSWLRTRFLIIDEVNPVEAEKSSSNLKHLIFKDEALIDVKNKQPIHFPLNFTGFLATNKVSGYEGMGSLLEEGATNRRYLITSPTKTLLESLTPEEQVLLRNISMDDLTLKDDFLKSLIVDLKQKKDTKYNFETFIADGSYHSSYMANKTTTFEGYLHYIFKSLSEDTVNFLVWQRRPSKDNKFLVKSSLTEKGANLTPENLLDRFYIQNKKHIYIGVGWLLRDYWDYKIPFVKDPEERKNILSHVLKDYPNLKPTHRSKVDWLKITFKNEKE